MLVNVNNYNCINELLKVIYTRYAQQIAFSNIKHNQNFNLKPEEYLCFN